MHIFIVRSIPLHLFYLGEQLETLYKNGLDFHYHAYFCLPKCLTMAPERLWAMVKRFFQALQQGWTEPKILTE